MHTYIKSIHTYIHAYIHNYTSIDPKYLLKGFNDRVQCKDSMSRYDGILEKPAHRQPVIEAAHAQATSYIGSPSTGNQV